MKKIFLLSIQLCVVNALVAQSYPEPEFSNEVYYLKKGDTVSVVRLEKNTSKLEYKSKVGGMGGVENGYFMEGEKSPVRLQSGKALSFVFSRGASVAYTAQKDSMMIANGIDPSMMSGMDGMSDPSTSITLYKAEAANGKRKILTMKVPGAMSFGLKKMQSSDVYTFSVKKVREGYWELVIDKTLPSGEYGFSMMGISMDGSATLFAFGVD